MNSYIVARDLRTHEGKPATWFWTGSKWTKDLSQARRMKKAEAEVEADVLNIGFIGEVYANKVA